VAPASAGSTGTDGRFEPTGAVTLAVPDDGTFDFTDIFVGPAATVTFSGLAAGQSVFLLASGAIVVDGVIDARPGSLVLDAPTVTVNGTVMGETLVIKTAGTQVPGGGSVVPGGCIALSGYDCAPVEAVPGGGVQPGGGNIQLLEAAVPEPGIYALLAAGLGALLWQTGRVRAAGLPGVRRLVV
jgi:hypothetical protein